MSTSKIAKGFNPKTAVNPHFGKQAEVKKEEVDKVEQALIVLTDEITFMVELAKEQNQAIKLLFDRVDTLQSKIEHLEQRIQRVHEKQTEEITDTISAKLDAYKKEENEKKSKSWWR